MAGRTRPKQAPPDHLAASVPENGAKRKRGRRPVVAVDLDGVLGDQVEGVLSRLREESRRSFPRQRIVAWNSRLGRVPFDKLMQRYLMDPKFVESMRVVPGSKRGMARLMRMAKVAVLTKRPQVTRAPTVKWVYNHFGKKPRVAIFEANPKSRFPARILVDDNLDNAADFAQSGRNRCSVLFSRPWNRDRSSVRPLIEAGKIVVAKDWDQVTKAVRKAVSDKSRTAGVRVPSVTSHQD